MPHSEGLNPSRCILIGACYECGPMHIKFHIYKSGCILEEQWEDFDIPSDTTHIVVIEMFDAQWAVKYCSSEFEAMNHYKQLKNRFQTGEDIDVQDLKCREKPIRFSWRGVSWAWK